jgi:ribonuclease HI
MTENKIIVYTDGACSGNPGPGGWAAIILYGEKEIILRGGEAQTTNNRMELTAIINTFQYLQENFPSLNREVEIYSDSKYVIDGITSWMPNWIKRGWKGSDKKPVKNRDLWETINHLRQGLILKFIWVKGHNKDKYNEMADEIAVEESRAS